MLKLQKTCFIFFFWYLYALACVCVYMYIHYTPAFFRTSHNIHLEINKLRKIFTFFSSDISILIFQFPTMSYVYRSRYFARMSKTTQRCQQSKFDTTTKVGMTDNSYRILQLTHESVSSKVVLCWYCQRAATVKYMYVKSGALFRSGTSLRCSARIELCFK